MKLPQLFQHTAMCKFSLKQNKGHPKNRMSFTLVREMGLEPTRQY